VRSAFSAQEKLRSRETHSHGEIEDSERDHLIAKTLPGGEEAPGRRQVNISRNDSDPHKDSLSSGDGPPR